MVEITTQEYVYNISYIQGPWLLQTIEYAHPVMKNLLLHNDHWKDKQVVIGWQYELVRVGSDKGQNWVVGGANLGISRLKRWRRVQGWKIDRWGGRYR